MLYEPRTAAGERLPGGFRAADVRWDPTPKRVVSLVLGPGEPPMYKVEGHDKLFIREHLQVVDKGEQAPLPLPAARGAREEPQAEAAPPPGTFIVESIVGREKQKGRVMMRVKWKGYPESESSWEPRARLMEDVPELVKAYEKTHR